VQLKPHACTLLHTLNKYMLTGQVFNWS